MSYSYPKALYLVRLQVENASIISSHLTWGFPAPSAFTGFAHALQRKLNTIEQYRDIECCGVGILCHQFTPQVTKSSDYRYSPYQLNLARHPLESDGSTPAMVEEGKGHFEVTLVIGLSGEDVEQHLSANDNELNLLTQNLIKQINQFIYGMRLAGGAVFPHRRVKPKLMNWSLSDAVAKTKKLRHWLLPGFALLHRHEVLLTHQKWLGQQETYFDTQGHEPNVLDTLLDISRLNLASTEQAQSGSEEEPKGVWQVRPRPEHLKGWLVPIPIGYAALIDLQEKGVISGLRDHKYPATFVETLLSLGEWQSPHRINDLTEILWTYNPEPKVGVYELIQPFSPKLNIQLLSNDLEEQSFEFDEPDLEEQED
ncbi:MULTISPECIES: type I-F CRISPR-associated protein Csy2 [unclassified Acinetobacter]|uniref:type I-F CRISPR-associated protein Csy2 n=1 Tax=unclassified Acinetobacter TaxID=196816 RepID=UPI00190C8051|nr:MULTISPECIES: type I-F CRISPR-associated protein Csy2 [unclassified Acinetobacter]MBK0063611.1 type I-F CRISPR-associated protein Csy2 [Acinetobacter sp. S55]MBK0067489.1 type I-F CRISPR-associated protein Csy2 [Acinetobacter sp. S54]